MLYTQRFPALVWEQPCCHFDDFDDMFLCDSMCVPNCHFDAAHTLRIQHVSTQCFFFIPFAKPSYIPLNKFQVRSQKL